MRLRRAGAAVVGLDLDPAVSRTTTPSTSVPRRRRATSLTPRRLTRRSCGPSSLRRASTSSCATPGVFPPSTPIEDARQRDVANGDGGKRRRQPVVAAIDARRCCALAPRGGRVVVIASKNVPAPGPGAAAYSASKAALTQLARVAALEWAGDGIRVNIVHPNAVFDTGIWDAATLASRRGQLRPDGRGVQDEQSPRRRGHESRRCGRDRFAVLDRRSPRQRARRSRSTVATNASCSGRCVRRERPFSQQSRPVLEPRMRWPRSSMGTRRSIEPKGESAHASTPTDSSVRNRRGHRNR